MHILVGVISLTRVALKSYRFVFVLIFFPTFQARIKLSKKRRRVVPVEQPGQNARRMGQSGSTVVSFINGCYNSITGPHETA